MLLKNNIEANYLQKVIQNILSPFINDKDSVKICFTNHLHPTSCTVVQIQGRIRFGDLNEMSDVLKSLHITNNLQIIYNSSNSTFECLFTLYDKTDFKKVMEENEIHQTTTYPSRIDIEYQEIVRRHFQNAMFPLLDEQQLINNTFF